ncbi:TetR/AcrR family transcriptional regulator [Nocardia sp. NPDC052316]|uniref:TetR/AcrR family transcriptional regulator n=1 Tax=Nocardia sp. NPDC052316 TaxID=3364329 RepID=UPI0037C70FF1
MSVNEFEREQAILDAAADLLCRIGYNKLTMGDVADAVALHRGLVYLQFKSKDELVEATVRRELSRYADMWRAQLEADPQAGSVASVYRAMVHTLTRLPLAAAVVARDEDILGKYLRKPGNVFDRLPKLGTGDFLLAMQEAGTVRSDVDIRTAAFILDALTPAIRRTLPSDRAEPADPDQPSADELLTTLADLLERALTPSEGADLARGKALLLDQLARAGANFGAEPAPQEGKI